MKNVVHVSGTILEVQEHQSIQAFQTIFLQF